MIILFIHSSWLPLQTVPRHRGDFNPPRTPLRNELFIRTNGTGVLLNAPRLCVSVHRLINQKFQFDFPNLM
jgi:hypothetical protein